MKGALWVPPAIAIGVIAAVIIARSNLHGPAIVALVIVGLAYVIVDAIKDKGEVR